MMTAIAVYITIVGLVYNSILRFLWKPEDLQWIVDELIHSVIPLLFISFSLLILPKGKLHWKSVLAWLLYPLITSHLFYYGEYPPHFILIRLLMLIKSGITNPYKQLRNAFGIPGNINFICNRKQV